MAEEKSGKKVIALNREARHEYFVVEALETGIELVGTEVKSLRAGGANLKDSWADTSAPTTTATSLTKIRAVPAVCWPIKARSAAWGSRSSCKVTRWFRFRSTLKRGVSSWSWACARVKNCMTSVPLLPHAMPSVILSAR